MVATLVVTGIFALAMIVAVAGVLGGIAASGLAAGWVPGVRYVRAPAATGVLLAFEVGALLAGAGSLGPFRIIL